MNKLFRIVVAFALVVSFCGCSQVEDILPKQKEQIVKFLTSLHSPALVAEEVAEKGQAQQFYSTRGDGVYRYIETYYSAGRQSWPEVTPESVVTITFSAYVFAYKVISPTQTLPYLSNNPVWKAWLTDPVTGLPTVAWPFEPLVIDMRNPGIIKGLELALVGCRAGDVVEAYMSYNMAYGDTYFSVIPKESPVAILFTVNSVE